MRFRTLFTYIRYLWQRLWHSVLPSSCLWCSLPVQQANQQLCQHCLPALPQLPYALCHYNLLWLPQISQGLPKPGFERLLALALYQQPYQHWIRQWKFQADLATEDWLLAQFSHLLQHYLAAGQPLPEAITFVPMHPKKRRKRGFNPAEHMAITAAETLKLPLLPLFERRQHSHSQLGLNRRQRLKNLHQAYQFSPQAPLILPSSVALIDDVLTTGATASELCRLLRARGVSQISVWTLAVTPTPSHKKNQS
ncbi:ComF family protein [Arsukibacterium sp.]|uniref:ComF family protein n=1 Tax=Arsukibacterium sp. TaxID=1977258 RepID=UPI002FDA0EBA